MNTPLTPLVDYLALTRLRIARLVEHGVSLRSIIRGSELSHHTSLTGWDRADWNPTSATLVALEPTLLALENALLPAKLILPNRPGQDMGLEQQVKIVIRARTPSRRLDKIKRPSTRRERLEAESRMAMTADAAA